MEGSRAAIRYAKAVLELATEKNEAATVYENMQDVAKTIASSNELKVLLKSPLVKASDKKAALSQIFSSINPIVNNLIAVLDQNNRIAILDLVAQKYIALHDELTGKQVAVVTTAIPLDDALKAKVLVKVKELTGKEAILENKVDASIIGGFVLRVGDIQYNASVAKSLNNLKREFSNNSYVSN
ncbi:ATP synthase F1 subunit delta [Zhouia sp. PK063]|uniref:ATP synthase F1 subunit delta n=1 Tax=Zhouia sp. PK063 TaxID=3373602 RepID=UPI0037922F7B